MKVHILTAIALAGLALGVMHVLNYRTEQRSRQSLRAALDDWETEGGAVPVSPEGPDTEARAQAILERLGAVAVGRAEGEWREGEWTDFDPRVPPRPVDPAR